VIAPGLAWPREVARDETPERARPVHKEGRMTERTNKAMDRRSFLRNLGGASTVAAAAVAAPIAATDANAYDPGSDETKDRYRESEHVKAFYRTNGYETLKK
jgi:hypothetical protein